MVGDESRLLELADLVLDGRPIDWASVPATLPAAQQALVSDLQALARITSFHLESSVASGWTTIRRDEGGATELAPGQSWGPLTVIGLIGHGRFGDVYHAREPRLDRPVALKLLRERTREDADALAVIDEARLLARVRHPNVVTVFGAERLDGRVGLWMELVEGRTLEAELTDRGPLPWHEVVQIGIDLAGALEAAHGAGLLHRDLKAQNVLRDREGRVALADFGAGAIVTSDADEPIEIAGTPLYLAPEVFAGAGASRASDIYSLGVLLFHLLTASYPVRGRSLADLRDAHIEGRRSSLAEARPDLPRALATVVDRAIAASPQARWPRAADVGEALLRVTTAESPARPETARVWRRLAWTGALAAAVTLLAAGVTWRTSWPQSGDANAAAAARALDSAAGPRKIQLPAFNMGRPSRDGSVFPYATDAGVLHVWEVRTGRSRQLTDGTQPPETGRRMVASPTGDRVAYPWSYGPDGVALHVIRSDGTWPSVVLPRQTAYQPVPVDWSPDGREILCWLRQKNGSVDLVLVPAEGGNPRLLQTFATDWPLHGRFSPDGRSIAIARADAPDSVIGDVFVLGTDGSPPRLVVEGANIANAPTWMPDGRLLFMRQSTARQGAQDAWVVQLSTGVVQGEPSRLMENLGFAIIDVTSRGELYRNLERLDVDVYTASIDLTGATPAGPPTRISLEQVGNHGGPSWSADGRLLAYFTNSDRGIPGAVPERTLTLQDMATGRTQMVSVPLNFLAGYLPIWHPDSRSLLVQGKDTVDDARLGFYRVDLATGVTTPFVIRGPRNLPSFGAFDPEGRRFFYSDSQRGLLVRRVSDGAEELLVPNGPREAIVRVFMAPDGHAIAFGSSTRQGAGWTTAVEILEEGGEPRLVRQSLPPLAISLEGWSPDSRSILYTIGEGARRRPFWRHPLESGKPVDLQFGLMFSPNPISLSPDGRRIAYVERFVERELWISPLGSGHD